MKMDVEDLIKLLNELGTAKGVEHERKRHHSKAQYKALIKAIHKNKRMSASAKRKAIHKLKSEMRRIKK